MRLFSALAVPDAVAERLDLFDGGLAEARWIDAADMHLTLAFFGELGRPVAEELAQELSEIALPAVDVRLTGLSVFGADRPRAIVALAERSPGLIALEAAHRAAMARVGVAAESRKYTPHVTLARLHRTTAGEVARWLSQTPVFAPLTWRAPGFAVFSAASSRGGGPYRIEVEFPLAQR